MTTTRDAHRVDIGGPIEGGSAMSGPGELGAGRALAPGAAAALGRLLVASATLGGMFVVFDYGIDGYALKILADEWAAASGTERAQLQLMAETAIWFLNGTFRAEIAIFYGLTVLIAGLAVALDHDYPTWFGVIAAVAGAVVLGNGLTSFAGVGLGNQDFLLFVVTLPVESAWLIGLGVAMWRRAGRARTGSDRAWAA